MTRAELNTKFKEILNSNNVYFQPPENIKLNYPCIIYERDLMAVTPASNALYKYNICYSVTYISRGVDTVDTLLNIMQLPMCRHERHFVTDHMNHDLFRIYI